jgi:chromosome segregation ATPase
MTARNLKVVVRHKPARSQEREALAAAIADLTAAERKAHQARDAKERAEALVTQAEAKLDAAKAGIEKAKTHDAAALAKAASTGTKPRADGTLRSARQCVTDAEDGLEAARAALIQCDEALTNVEQELKSDKSSSPLSLTTSSRLKRHPACSERRGSFKKRSSISA